MIQKTKKPSKMSPAPHEVYGHHSQPRLGTNARAGSPERTRGRPCIEAVKLTGLPRPIRPARNLRMQRASAVFLVLVATL